LKTDVIDKIVQEWAYRCEKGYPDIMNAEDSKILKEIYTEFGVKLEEEVISQDHGDYERVEGEDNVYVRAKDVNRETGEPNPSVELYKVVGSGKGKSKAATKYVNINAVDKKVLEEEEVEKVLSRAGVSDGEINLVKQNDNYRRASNIEEFIKDIKVYMEAFYELLHDYKIPKGGKGELLPLVSIKGARIGGANEKDITDSNGKVLEVKDFSSGNEISLATGGSTLGSIFLKNYETFRNQVAPFNKVPEFRFILPGVEKLTSIPEMYLDELTRLLDNFPLDDKSIGKEYVEVKIAGKKYLVKKDQEYTLKVDQQGMIISSETSPELGKKQEFELRKLMEHPWVVGGSAALKKNLNEIKSKGLQGIDYLMIYDRGKTVILDMRKEEDRSRLTVKRIANGILTLKLNY